MRIRPLIIGIATCCFFAVQTHQAHAAPTSITYRYKHFSYVIPTTVITSWQQEQERWTYNNVVVPAPAAMRVEGDEDIPLPTGFERSRIIEWDTAAIEQSIRDIIEPQIYREAGDVTILQNGSGAITFEGAGFMGRTVDMEKAVAATITALENDISNVLLPVQEVQPNITVGPKLSNLGIKEVVTIGESDFAGSTANRIHNITVGLNRFNGHLIEQGETFSFVEILGPVNGATGYRKELTILGDKTVPDYGGGLCQVSSTAYRGVWEYGFPITQRKNHSYSVHYYSPQGTDATVYPPNVDIKFLNDSPGALLIQTVLDVPNAKAYFIYYGTKDDRESDVIGPFTWGYVPAPPPRTEYTTEIAPGTRRKVGDAVQGLRAAWFRMTKKDNEKTVEGTYSIYEARPLYYQVGVEELPTGSGSLSNAPASENVLSD